MLTSLSWLNRYLAPADATAEQVDHALTHAGFPIEGQEETDTGHTVLDVELTSNRGDCLSHVGLAREVAISTDRSLVLPLSAYDIGPTRTEELASVSNTIPDVCPRFCARVIQNVKVGPSPDWLRESLEAVGVKSINNIVDATNWVLFELGHPSHAFDLSTLAGKKLVIRKANAGETLVALDDKEHKLVETDLVVADEERAVSIAGVIGGKPTSVTESTTDILLEMATWHPATVRRTARRLGISTDSVYRYERIVDPRDLEAALDRLTGLIVELAGGSPSAGILKEGAALPPQTRIALRPARVEHILGINVPAERIVELMVGIGVETEMASEHEITCVIPHHRPDLTREIDLVEEVARLHGFDALEGENAINVSLDISQPGEWALREQATKRISETLVGCGFFETVTFSFETKENAQAFLPKGLRLVKVDEDRRKEAPYLRPAITPSLLTCRKANQDGRVSPPGGVRLFELASTFAEKDDGETYARDTVQTPTLSLLLDAGTKFDAQQAAIRTMRGSIDAVATALGGEFVSVQIKQAPPAFAALDAAASARIILVDKDGNETYAGFMGLISKKAQSKWSLEQPVVVAELALPALIALYPPKANARHLPAFPPIDRDLSVIVEESVAWADIAGLIEKTSLDRLVSHDFVGVFRGKQVGSGKKSVTFSLRFRDDARTLRHEEVDPQVDQLVNVLKSEVKAELRA